MIRKPVPRHAPRLLEAALEEASATALFWLSAIESGSCVAASGSYADDPHGLELYARLAGDGAAAAWSCAQALLDEVPPC